MRASQAHQCADVRALWRLAEGAMCSNVAAVVDLHQGPYRGKWQNFKLKEVFVYSHTCGRGFLNEDVPSDDCC